MKNKIKIDRFYKMDKALQLVEGTTVAALWAHLIDSYNYFLDKDMIELENTMYQASKGIQAFTGIGTKAQNTARKRLEDLGFLKSKVAAIPGHATKSRFYILFPSEYEEWGKQHDYDKLRDDKYHELQDSKEHEKLEQWIKDEMKDEHKQLFKRLEKKQSARGTFANHTQGHLQTIPSAICITPKEQVIETKEIETLKKENTQKNNVGCVYSGQPYKYLKGKTKDELLDLILETYKKVIVEYHPDYVCKSEFEEKRFIGSLNNIEKEFKNFEIDVATNCYIGILGYLDEMVEQLAGNPTKFRSAYRLENLLKFHQDTIFSRDNKKRGERIYESNHRPEQPEYSL